MQALPPPDERFDPILGRWEIPGGPLHDPARDAFDPDYTDPLELVEPIPPELKDWRGAGPPVHTSDRGRRTAPSPFAMAAWLVLAIVAVVLSAILLSSQIGYCPETGKCAVAYGGGPPGWITAAALVGFAVYAARRALRHKS